jgi:hypothetical protein
MALKLAPAVVVAGTLLGWLLGSAADPMMKQRIEPGGRSATQSAPTLLPDQGWPDLAPEGLYPSDGYSPDLNYDDAAVGTEWALPDDQAEPYLAPSAPLDDTLEAARAAERAADEAARAIAAQPSARPEPESGSRKSALSQSGLY